MTVSSDQSSRMLTTSAAEAEDDAVLLIWCDFPSPSASRCAVHYAETEAEMHDPMRVCSADQNTMLTLTQNHRSTDHAWSSRDLLYNLKTLFFKSLKLCRAVTDAHLHNRGDRSAVLNTQGDSRSDRRRDWSPRPIAATIASCIHYRRPVAAIIQMSISHSATFGGDTCTVLLRY